METKRLFDYGSKTGLSDFQRDVVKLLLEDRDFFIQSIGVLDQNTFNDWSLRSIVGLLKDTWKRDGKILGYDGLLILGKQYFKNEYDLQEIEEYIRVFKEKEFTAERIAELKYLFKYWNSFYALVRLANHIQDSISDGICSAHDLDKVIRTAIEDCRVLEDLVSEDIKAGEDSTWNW